MRKLERARVPRADTTCPNRKTTAASRSPGELVDFELKAGSGTGHALTQTVVLLPEQ